jgi:hypothetical protein
MAILQGLHAKMTGKYARAVNFFLVLLASSASASQCRCLCCGWGNLRAHHLIDLLLFLAHVLFLTISVDFMVPVAPLVLLSLRELTCPSDELVQRRLLGQYKQLLQGQYASN